MKEQGVVVETSINTAKIRLTQRSECAKCGICSGTGGGFQILSVKTDKPLQINQTVTIEINQKLLTASSILLYGAPLSGFIAGAIIGYVIGKEILAIIFAIGLMIIDLIAVRIIIKKIHLAERIAIIQEEP